MDRLSYLLHTANIFSNVFSTLLRYMKFLTRDTMQPSTKMHYLHAIKGFLLSIQEVKPKHCELTKNDFIEIIREVEAVIKVVNGEKQVRSKVVKRQKLETIPLKKDLIFYKELARKKLPEILGRYIFSCIYHL